MNRRERREALTDLREVFLDVSLAVAQVARLHEDEPEGAAIAQVWHQARLVLASALVEHQRLLGVNVKAAEQALCDAGWVPWRDLQDSSSDSETVAPPTVEETNALTPTALEPQLHLLRWRDSHLYVAVPLAVDLSQLHPEGE